MILAVFAAAALLSDRDRSVMLSADRAAAELRSQPIVKELRSITPAPGGKGTLLLGLARDSHGVELRFAVFVGTVTATIRKRALLRSSESHFGLGNWSLYTDDYEAAPRAVADRKAEMWVRIELLLCRLTSNVPPGV